MELLKKEVVFIDAENHRARVSVEITDRNGYPEFTMTGRYMGSFGQCLDSIKPASEAQTALIAYWTAYHLKNVSAVTDLRERVLATIAAIETEEAARPATDKTGDEAIIEMMENEGIDEGQLEAVKAYMYLLSSDDLSDFEEAYSGWYSSDEEFAQQMAEDTDAINSDATWPNNCIDWERAARELMYDYMEHEGHYFRNV